MPIKRAALRQLRKDKRRTVRNQSIASELKTLKKRFLTLAASNRDEAAKLLPTVVRHFDRAATHGKIHRNTASRVKSRLQRLVSGTK